MKKKKPPKPEKGSPVFSNSTKRRLAIQRGSDQPHKETVQPTHGGANCVCLYCRSQRPGYDKYGR